MNRRTTITLFYLFVALVSAAILGTAFFLRSRLPKPEMPDIVNAGRESVMDWFEIERDLEAVNQEGRRVKLSDLKGKVWIVTEFFAVCPHCARRNGEELNMIREEFGDHPDFHIVCISVDPERDTVERLKDYSDALNADPANWWFLNAGEAGFTHDYLENVLKFFAIKKRTDPVDIETNGLYAHDLGIMLVDRDFRAVGKWPLADARSEEARQRDPDLYQTLKDNMFRRIRLELDKPATTLPNP